MNFHQILPLKIVLQLLVKWYKLVTKVGFFSIIYAAKKDKQNYFMYCYTKQKEDLQ